MQPMQPMYGAQGQGQGMGYNPQAYQQMRQFATPAETVHQHMQQDAQHAQPSYGYAPMSSMGMGHSMLSQFGSNPQMVRQHIQQDMQAYGQGSMGQAQMAHYGGSYGQPMGYGQSQAHSVSMQGREAYQHSGGMYPQQQGGYGMANFGYGAAAGMGQGAGYGSGSYGQQAYGQPAYQQMMHMQAQAGSSGQPYGYGAVQGHAARGAFAQYGTDPQVVRQHIQQDLGYYGAMQ